MLRRSFLKFLTAAVVVPAVMPLEAFVPSPIGPVLAVEMTDPYWLLEMRAYERFLATWQRARVNGVKRRDIPKLPIRPQVTR
jgi:hypothetical protein